MPRGVHGNRRAAEQDSQNDEVDGDDGWGCRCSRALLAVRGAGGALARERAVIGASRALARSAAPPLRLAARRLATGVRMGWGRGVGFRIVGGRRARAPGGLRASAALSDQTRDDVADLATIYCRRPRAMSTELPRWRCHPSALYCGRLQTAYRVLVDPRGQLRGTSLGSCFLLVFGLLDEQLLCAADGR